MGFCLFNNIAIAAQDALASGLERVLVVDYDAHHGNGTERAFWNEPRAAYFSTHQEGIYPGSGFLQAASHAKGRIGKRRGTAYPCAGGQNRLLRHAHRKQPNRSYRHVERTLQRPWIRLRHRAQ